MKKRLTHLALAAGEILALGVVISAGSASAQTSFWVANGIGNWNTPANWSGGIPKVATFAEINNAGTAQLFDPGARAYSLTLGNGTLEVSGGNAIVDNDIQVGGNGAGALRIINNGRVSNEDGTIAAGSTATVSGTNSTWSNGGVLYISSTGTLSVQDGGLVESSNSIVGGGAGTTGAVAISGENSRWTNTWGLYVGFNGRNGTLSITGGGDVSTGIGSIDSGTVTVAGSGSTWTSAGELVVGESHSGAIHVTGGGVVSSASGSVGSMAHSTGTVTVAGAVAGANSRWTNSGDLNVGILGSGALNITGGGKVSANNGYIGSGAGSSGTATINGAGSAWTNTNELAVGSSGDGALNITGGGVVESTTGYIGRHADSSGTVLIDGPGSRWNASGAFTMGVQGAFLGTSTSTLTVRNGGVLSAAGGVTVGTLATLRGDGTIVGNVLAGGGTVAPGTSPGTLRISGNYRHSFNATLQIELASPASFDKLAVTGNIDLVGPGLAGSVLQVSLADGYVPNGSRSFDILDWGGSLSGTFASIQLPTLGGTLVWNTSQLYTTGVLTVVGPPANFLAADFDESGAVNGADLARWRNGFGSGSTHMQGNADADGDVDGGDLLVWQRQLGSMTVVTVSGAVPEPVSMALLTLALPLLRGRNSISRD